MAHVTQVHFINLPLDEQMDQIVNDWLIMAQNNGWTIISISLSVAEIRVNKITIVYQT